MNYLLDLFSDIIEEAQTSQNVIDRIESREQDIKNKKAVLAKAYNKSNDPYDRGYFKSEIDKLYEEQERLKVTKSEKQELHKELARRVEIIKQSATEYEQEWITKIISVLKGNFP